MAYDSRMMETRPPSPRGRRRRAQALNGAVGAKADRLGAGSWVGDHIDHCWLAGLYCGIGTLQGRTNLVRCLDILAVATKHLRELIVAGEAEVAASHTPHGSPAAVVTHHDQDGDLVPHRRVHLHAVHPKGTIPTEHDHLLVRFGDLGPEAVG